MNSSNFATERPEYVWAREFYRRAARNFQFNEADHRVDVNVDKDGLLGLLAQVIHEAQMEIKGEMVKNAECASLESDDGTLFCQYPKAKIVEITDLLRKAQQPQITFTGDFQAMAKEAHEEGRRLILAAIELLSG